MSEFLVNYGSIIVILVLFISFFMFVKIFQKKSRTVPLQTSFKISKTTVKETILIKGVFSKENIVSILLIIVGIVCLIASFNPDREKVICIISSIVCFFFWWFLSFCSLVVSDKRVYGKAAFGKRVDLPLDMISSVGTSFLKGISVATSSGRIAFYLCENRDEVFNVISKLLLERQENQKPKETMVKQQIPQSSADELKKYKELLDSGVITQQEFDAKKKQLLGL